MHLRGAAAALAAAAVAATATTSAIGVGLSLRFRGATMHKRLWSAMSMLTTLKLSTTAACLA
jgi:hypothetical protein